jgi:hypothetical protein
MKFATSIVALVASAAAVSAAPAFARNGDGTWYDVSVGYTACGTLHGNGEYVIAVDHAFYECVCFCCSPRLSLVADEVLPSQL